MSEHLGLAYHRVHRGGLPGWWRGLLGVLLVVVLAVIANVVAVLMAAVGYVLMGVRVQDVMDKFDGSPVTPGFLLAVNLGWALAIPAAWLVMQLHGLRPRWLASVAPRIRWRWFLTCLGLSGLALIATVLVSMLVPAEAAGGEMGGELNDFTARTRDFLLVVVLFTPLQAAGEEYLFRGYLTQGLGGMIPNPRVAVAAAIVVPAVLFALAHGIGQDPPIFFDRLAFGLVAGVLTIATGGLEAGIAMHVLNNFLAYGFALAFGDMDSALNPTSATWWRLPTTLTQSLVYLGLAIWWARRVGLRTRTTSDVLVGPAARV